MPIEKKSGKPEGRRARTKRTGLPAFRDSAAEVLRDGAEDEDHALKLLEVVLALLAAGLISGKALHQGGAHRNLLPSHKLGSLLLIAAIWYDPVAVGLDEGGPSERGTYRQGRSPGPVGAGTRLSCHRRRV